METQSLSKFFIILISPTAEPSKILFCYHPHGLHHHRQRHARRDSRGLRHHRQHRTETQCCSLPTPVTVQALESPTSHRNSLHQCPTVACITSYEEPHTVLPRAAAFLHLKNATDPTVSEVNGHSQWPLHPHPPDCCPSLNHRHLQKWVYRRQTRFDNVVYRLGSNFIPLMRSFWCSISAGKTPDRGFHWR